MVLHFNFNLLKKNKGLRKSFPGERKLQTICLFAKFCILGKICFSFCIKLIKYGKLYLFTKKTSTISSKFLTKYTFSALTKLSENVNKQAMRECRNSKFSTIVVFFLKFTWRAKINKNVN